MPCTLLTVLVLTGVVPQAGPGPSVPPDKSKIYGSATLVPTPAGERARQELALAGEASRLLSRLPGVVDEALTVRLGPPTEVSGVVVVEADGESPAPESLAKLVAGATGAPRANVALTVRAQQASDASPRNLLPLGLAVLGLGVCLGIFMERWRSRRVALDDMHRGARYR